MKNTWQKIKLILFPSVLLVLIFSFFYSLLNWLIFIKLELFDVNESILDFFLPLLLLTGFFYVFLKSRLDLLRFKSKYYMCSAIYMFIAAIFFVLPISMVQDHLKKSCGKLTELQSMSSIKEHKKTKYYAVKKYFVSDQDVGVHFSLEKTGNRDKDLNLSLFFAFPIYDSSSEIHKPTTAWLGVKYFKKISNSLSAEEKNKQIDAFLSKSEDHLNSRDLQKFTYLDRIGKSSDLNEFREALKKSPVFTNENDVILLPSDMPFEARTADDGDNIRSAAIFAFVIWLILLLFPRFDEDKLTAYLSDRPMTKSKGMLLQEESESESWDEFFSVFWPTREHFITPILANLCIGIFIAMACIEESFSSFKPLTLLCWGANYAPSINEGEYWRLLTSAFLHDGFKHLVLNVIALIFVGAFLEPVLGSLRLTIIYVILAIGSSLASFYWSSAISVGASGAILGLYGLSLTLLLLTNSRLSIAGQFLYYYMGIFVLATLTIGLFLPDIDNAAHVGGLLLGFAIGCLFAWQKDKLKCMRLL